MEDFITTFWNGYPQLNSRIHIWISQYITCGPVVIKFNPLLRTISLVHFIPHIWHQNHVQKDWGDTNPKLIIYPCSELCCAVLYCTLLYCVGTFVLGTIQYNNCTCTVMDSQLTYSHFPYNVRL